MGHLSTLSSAFLTFFFALQFLIQLASPVSASGATPTAGQSLPFGRTEVAGPGWAAFMIHTDGSAVGIKLWATSPASPNVLGAFFYDEQEEFLGGFDFSVHRPELGAKADINVIPGDPIHQEITIQAEPEGGFGMTPTYDPHGVPSTFKVLVFGAGSEVSWSYDGSDNPGDVRLLGIDSGTSAFIYLSDEFVAAANVEASVLGPGGRVTLMGDLAMTVRDTLIANWIPISSLTTIPSSGVSINTLTITTPKGEEQCLYAGLLGCSWPRFRGDTAHGPGSYVFHMTGDGVGLAQNADDVMLYGADARLPVDQTQIIQAVSRRTHGAAGDFDIDLPLAGNPGIESRSGGANGDYTIAFTFPNSLTSVESATVAGGIGSVSSSNIDPNDAHNYIVNLTGVSNAQIITVSLRNVIDSAGNFSPAVTGSMGVLIGDVNASGVVTSGDTNLCKAQALQPVTQSNFRNDINCSGAITTGDVNIIKQNALSQLPP